MSKKSKVITFMSLVAFTVSMIVVGIFATQNINFTLGGSMHYIAPGVEATISKGTMSNGVWVNSGVASSKMQLVQITKTDTKQSLDGKFASWQQLEINFNEAGDDILISFSITNNMANKYLSISVTNSYITAKNCEISVNKTGVNLAPSQSENFVVAMTITNKFFDAEMSGFSVIFNMEMTTTENAENLSYLTFTYDNTNMTAEVGGAKVTVEEAIIPSYVVYNNKTYKVTSIASTAFSGMGLNHTICSKVAIPNTVTTIGDYAFQWNKNLTSIIIPSSVTSVGTCLFYECSNLVSAEVYATNVALTTTMFGRCTKLESVTLSNTITAIGDQCFAVSTSLESIYIPASVKEINKSSFVKCESLESIVIDEANPIYDSRNNCNAVIETASNTLVCGCKTSTVPLGIKTIGEFAFLGQTTLTSITISEEVTSICKSAFANCTALTTVCFEGTNLPNIEDDIFSNCTALSLIKVPNESLQQYQNLANLTDYRDIMVGV